MATTSSPPTPEDRPVKPSDHDRLVKADVATSLMYSLYQRQKFTDIIIECTDRVPVHAHKAVLATQERCAAYMCSLWFPGSGCASGARPLIRSLVSGGIIRHELPHGNGCCVSGHSAGHHNIVNKLSHASCGPDSQQQPQLSKVMDRRIMPLQCAPCSIIHVPTAVACPWHSWRTILSISLGSSSPAPYPLSRRPLLNASLISEVVMQVFCRTLLPARRGYVSQGYAAHPQGAPRSFYRVLRCPETYPGVRLYRYVPPHLTLILMCLAWPPI